MTAVASTPATIGGAAPPTGSARRRPRRWPNVVGVGLVTSLFAALYSAYLLGQLFTLKAGMADVGEYDQAISGYAHFIGPHSLFIGMYGNPNSAGGLQLSDHFTPLLALLAPFYWIHDGPQTLLIETGVLAALPMIPLWMFTRRAVGEFRLAGSIAAYLVVIAYGFSWPLQEALWFEFHEVFLAIPIMVWMIERAQAGRLRQAALVSLLLLGVKDDLGFVVAIFGVYLATKDKSLLDWARFVNRVAHRPRAALEALRRRDRLWLLALVPIGLGMVLLVNDVLLPYFGGSPTRNFTYTEFGATPSAAIHTMIGHPLDVYHTLLNSPIKHKTLHMLLRPVLGVCLLSPLTLMGAPLLIERFLSVNELYWQMPYHYNAFLLPMIFCGAVDGAARLARWGTDPRLLGVLARVLSWLARLRPVQAVAARLGAARSAARFAWLTRLTEWFGRRFAGRLGGPGRRVPLIRGLLVTAFSFYIAFYGWRDAHLYPLHDMTKSAFWDTSNHRVVAAKHAATHVPDHVLVAAATQVGPQLLSRDRVILWDSPGDRGYPDAPWVVADVARFSWPFPNVQAQQADIEYLKLKGYQIVYQEDGYVVLHQGPPVTAVH
jgi:uncharacterized membrane protein